MGFTLCAYYNPNAELFYSCRAHVKAIGDTPHSQYVSKYHFGMCSNENVWLLYLSRDDWFSTVGNGECSQIEVVFENDSEIIHELNAVRQCGVSLVYEQDMELMGDLNQANAQCSSSSRVITFEGWDGVHDGFVSLKRSCDESEDEIDDEDDEFDDEEEVVESVDGTDDETDDEEEVVESVDGTDDETDDD